jgi:subtilase family serine protease
MPPACQCDMVNMCSRRAVQWPPPKMDIFFYSPFANSAQLKIAAPYKKSEYSLSIGSLSFWKGAEMEFTLGDMSRTHSRTLSAVILALTLSFHGQGSSGAAANELGRQRLVGHMEPAFARAPIIGRLAPDTTLHLAIGLPIRNGALLEREVGEIYDPSSQHFHQFLTPENVVKQFAPSEKDYRAVLAFVRAHDLTVTATYPHRLLVAIKGSAAAIEKTFHLSLTLRRRGDDTVYYAPDREPSVDLRTKILYISGLNNLILPKPQGSGGSGPGGSFAGTDFRNAYVAPNTLVGTGQSVGLFELDGYYVADVEQYQATFLAGFTPAVPVSVAASLDGFVATATQSGPPQGGCGAAMIAPGTPPAGTPGSAEPILDIDMAIAMAPGLAQLYVYEGCNGDHILAAIISRTKNGDLPKQLSASWPIPTDAGSVTFYKLMAAQGQSFLWAVGDGSATCPVSLNGNQQPVRPTMPDVTSVGGTVLTMSNDGAIWQSETAATDGGGLLQNVPMPNYQVGIAPNVVNPHHWRMSPDVAILSGDGTNFNSSAFIYWKGGGLFNTGTSVAAPLWAGFVALVNEHRATAGLGPIGYLNPALYAIAANPELYAQDFHDIRTGSSPAPPQNNCPNGVSTSAEVGYDLVTGLGSPKANLINDLTQITSPPRGGEPPPRCFSGLGEDEVWCERMQQCLPPSVYAKACTFKPIHPP